MLCPSGSVANFGFEVCQPIPLPPIIQGLIGFYTPETWNSVANAWADASGYNNHVTEVGGTGIAVARPQGAPAYIYGASTAWMRFPVGILPSADYTLLYVARYNGGSRERIFQGVSTNWLSGFHLEKAGVAYHGDVDCEWITQNANVHGSDWVLGADRSNSYRSNGVDRTTNSNCARYDRLAVNSGHVPREASDFAIQSVLVYQGKLSDADLQRAEAWLASLQPSFTPANLQVGKTSLFGVE